MEVRPVEVVEEVSGRKAVWLVPMTVGRRSTGIRRSQSTAMGKGTGAGGE